MTTEMTIPARFRSGEQRGARIGRVLKVVGGVREVDERLLDEIGRRFMYRDEVGAALVRAMRGPAGPDRVTMAQFEHALAHGVAAVDAAPPALMSFFKTVETVPDWVDIDLLNAGARAYRRFGRSSADVLLQLSLMGGYRFGGPTDLLVLTGGLSGDTTLRRLGETQRWAMAISEHDAMLRGGEGFRLTVHVRLMHAMVNHRFESSDRWDTATWGLPINQSDQAATLGLFNGALLLGVRALGVRVSRTDAAAVMHLWRYIGWLMGIDDDWLFETEREQHRFNYHVLLAEGDVTPAGAELANAIVDAQGSLHFERFARARRAYARARLLSMLRMFLGRSGLDDLGLPARVPWAAALVVPRNLVGHHVLGRTAWGERFLVRRGEKVRARIDRRHFGREVPQVAPIPQTR
jgi:hypothetical protein